MITQQVRSNASLKSIEKAQKQLKENWDKAFDNAEILFYEGILRGRIPNKRHS